MGFVNKVILLGNTTRDPQLRELPTGTHVCDFGIATSRVYKNAAGEEKQETAFVDCTAFGRTAEIVAEYCPRGRQLFVEGRLHYETWEDRDGNRRSRLSVIAENIQFVGNRAGAEGRQGELSLDAHRVTRSAAGPGIGNGKKSAEKRAAKKLPGSPAAPDSLAATGDEPSSVAVDVDDLPF